MQTVECYRAAVLTFESKKSYENPFLDCTVTAEFRGPAGACIVREAYWDGGQIYRVSFAPVATGVWEYILTAPKDSGLNGACGQIECVPYTGELEIYRHGFLKVSPD